MATRQEIENRHVELLVEHGANHLDPHEITTSRRVITQTIAADLFDRGASGVRFPSRLDGNACVALFETRGTASAAAEPVVLTDPAPESLTNATGPWGLCWSGRPRRRASMTTEVRARVLTRAPRRLALVHKPVAGRRAAGPFPSGRWTTFLLSR